MKAVVIGLGSIGQRHIRILTELGCEVHTISDHGARTTLACSTYGELNNLLTRFAPDYVVICNETSRHRESLEAVWNTSFEGKVLVEKPLFPNSVCQDAFVNRDQIYVGYHLRFHPLVRSLLARVSSEQIQFITATAGQYLPDWRPGRDYRTTYSSRWGEGGVLNDLSHEIDLLLLIAGNWSSCASCLVRSPTLEVDAEAIAHSMFEFESGVTAQIHLNYLERSLRRSLTVQTTSATYTLDFASQQLRVNGILEEQVSNNRDLPYKLMHERLLSSTDKVKLSEPCSFDEGIKVVHCIESLKFAAYHKVWKKNDFDL